MNKEYKEYFKRELTLNDKDLEEIYDLFEKHKVSPKLPDISPMTSFSIKYVFSTIGAWKVLCIGDKEFIIDEESLDNG